MPETPLVISRASQYGQPSFIEKIAIFPRLLTLPVVLVWAYIFNWSGRSRKRNLRDALTRFILTKFNIRQYQYLIGTTKDTYSGWCKEVKQEPHIEDIGEGANICWLGERRLENVIIFFHGGGYLFPAVGPHLKFWDHVRTKLVGRGVNVSVAAVAYTLVPVAAFPLQLKQAIAAINHVQSLGVKPQNIQLVGDSAGGNLILQVLAHLLHPLKYKNVPSLSLSAPLKGAYLMSPWVDLADLRGTLKKGDPYDMMPSKTLRYWGAQSLKPVPEEYLGYIQANSASDDWWKGVDVFVDRVLITAGRDECLRDEIIRFSTVFEKFHPQVNMHEHVGIHDDPLFAVELGESAGGATDTIIDWLQAGF